MTIITKFYSTQLALLVEVTELHRLLEHSLCLTHWNDQPVTDNYILSMLVTPYWELLNFTPCEEGCGKSCDSHGISLDLIPDSLPFFTLLDRVSKIGYIGLQNLRIRKGHLCSNCIFYTYKNNLHKTTTELRNVHAIFCITRKHSVSIEASYEMLWILMSPWRFINSNALKKSKRISIQA